MNFQNDSKEYIIDSDGSLVRYEDAYKNVTEASVEQARDIEYAILAEKASIENSFMKIALMLDVADRYELFKARGYSTMKEWVKSTEIDLSWQVAQAMLRIVREAIPVLMDAYGTDEKSAIEILAAARISKVRAALPLIRDGMENEFAEVIRDSDMYTYQDVVGLVKSLRGIEKKHDDPYPAMYYATVWEEHGKRHYKIRVTDGVTTEECGTIRISPKFSARFEDRFGDMLNIQET